MKRLCAVLLAMVLLSLLAVGANADPQAKSLIINPGKKDLDVHLWADKGGSTPSYRIGERVQLYFEVTENSFVTIFDVDANGKITQLFPNYNQSNDYARRNRTYLVPDGYEILAAAPTGQENLLIVATRNSPLDYPELLREKGLEQLISRLRRRLALSGEEWAMDLATLQILPERPSAIRMDVDSNISGVSLYVDGILMGNLPQRVNLEAGEHQLVAIKSGYKVAVRDIIVDQYSESGRWLVRLEALKRPSGVRFDFEIRL